MNLRRQSEATPRADRPVRWIRLREMRVSWALSGLRGQLGPSILHRRAVLIQTFVIDEALIGEVERASVLVVGKRQCSGGHDIVGASIATLTKASGQISRKALPGSIIAAVTCELLAQLVCIQLLAEAIWGGSRFKRSTARWVA